VTVVKVLDVNSGAITTIIQAIAGSPAGVTLTSLVTYIVEMGFEPDWHNQGISTVSGWHHYQEAVP